MLEKNENTQSADGTNGVALLSFVAGGQNYAVDILSVREIRSGARATALPHSPDYVRGVINLRGTVLTVMDLARRLGMDTETDDERAVVIVTALDDCNVGLMVDAVSDILSVPESELQPPPETGDSGAGFLRALAIWEDRMIRVIDLPAVLTHGTNEAAA